MVLKLLSAIVLMAFLLVTESVLLGQTVLPLQNACLAKDGSGGILDLKMAGTASGVVWLLYRTRQGEIVLIRLDGQQYGQVLATGLPCPTQGK